MSDFLGSLLNEKAPSVDTGTDFLGSLIPPEKAEKRNPFAVANDTVITGANAVLGGVQAVSDFVSPGNQFSQGVEALIREGEEKQSTAVKQGRAKLSAALESEDIGTQLRGVKNYVLENPLQAAAMAAGSFVPVGGAIGVARLGATALGAGAKVAGRTALGAGSLAGGAMAGGDAAGSAYQEVMNAPALANMPIDERERIATDAARKASAVPFVLGAASGLFGAEKALATGTKSILKTAGSEFITEAIEEGGTQLSSNIAAAQAGADVGTWKGVAGSAALGGVLGGGTGLAVGALQKQPDSLLEGSTNISTGNIAPDANAIDKAIDSNSSELGNTSAQAIFAEQRATELRAQAEQEQAKLQEVQDTQQQEAARQAQEQAQAAFNQGAVMYGVKPVEGTNRYQIGGKTLFTQNDAANFLKGIDQLNEGKPEEQKAILGAAISSGAVKVAPDATPKTVNNSATKFLQSYGFDSALDKADAAQRADVVIQSLEGPKALKQADVLNNFYKSITGTNSPAFDTLMSAVNQQEGVSNEQLQLQTNAGLRAVPVQGGATQTSGRESGNVRPISVQPIQSGSVGAGSLGLQTGAVPSVGVSTSTGANVSGIDLASQSNQEAQVISDERVDAINAVEQIAKRAFGERDYQIIMEFIQSDAAMNQSQVAEKFGISRQRVNQIVGAAKEGESFNETIERRAQESWGPRFLLAGRNMGYSKDEVRGLFEVIQKSQDETSLAAVQQAQALSEGATEEELQGKEKAESELEGEEARTLGMEETSDTEKGAAGYRVFTPGVSGETGIEGASSVNRAKFSKKALKDMSDEQLQNIAADEDTTEERLDDVINEMLRRQEIRVNKGKENAVQKPSAEKKAVRNKPAVSEGVREQDTEERQAAREGQTDEEAAAQAWNEGIKDFPEAPKFADLTEEQQDDWISFGPENWTKDDVQTELIKLAKEVKTPAKSTQESFSEFNPLIDPLSEEVDAALRGKTIKQALAWAQKNARNEYERMVLRYVDARLIELTDLGTEFDFKLTDPGKQLVGNMLGVSTISPAGLGSAQKVEVILNGAHTGEKAGTNFETLVHELIHAVSQAQLRIAPDGTAAKELKALYNEIIANFNAKAKAGTLTEFEQRFYKRENNSLADADELLAWGLTNKEFQEYLASVKVTPKVTLWNKFVRAIGSLLGTPVKADTALGQLMSISENLLSESIKPYVEEANKRSQSFGKQPNPTSFPDWSINAELGVPVWVEGDYALYKGTSLSGNTLYIPGSRKGDTSATAQVDVKNFSGKQIPASVLAKMQVVADSFRPKTSASIKKAREEASKQINKLPPNVAKPTNYVVDTIEHFAQKSLPYFAFTEDLADIAAKFIPSVKKYVNLMKERQATRTRLERQVDDILQEYDKLPSAVKGTGENSVNKFLMDSTRDGKWAYNPGWIKDFKEETDIDAGMEARFNALPASAQKLVQRVFAHGQSTLLAMQKAVIENINSEYDALIAAAKKAGNVTEEQDLVKKKASELVDYRRLMRVNSKKPYAPLKRFGDYVVVGKSKEYLANEKIVNDENADPIKRDEAKKELRRLEKSDIDYFVQFAETIGEAKAIARQEAGNYAQVEDFEKDTSNTYGGRDINSTFHRLRNLVEDTKDSNLGDASERAVNRLLADLHLTLLSEQSARQSERRRRGIGGAEKDMMRAFATQGRATASFISSLENTGNIYDILREMKEETDKGTVGTRGERRQYYNEFMKRHFMGMDYRPSPFMDKALSTTSMWMLLTNPAYFLQNMTQPFMMSLPVIGARYGYARSWKEMTRAYTDIASVIKKHGLSEESYNKLPEDVRNVVEVLVNRGRIDISLEQDLGRWRSTEDAKLAKFGRASELLRGMAQDIETINRVATAVAAYRLALKGPKGNPTMATNYADNIIYTTHGDYSSFNAPRITRQVLGRLATQFRKFQLIQISLIARLYNDAFRSEDADTRAIGKRALAYTLGHTAVMGGIMGLPGFAAIAALYGMLFGDEDEPDTPELALRRAIGDDSLADLLVKGVPAALGVDVSGKLGMGQMLSILPYTDVKFTRKDLPAAGYALLTGPFGGLTLKGADAVNYMGSGDYQKGLEQLLPSGLGNVLKAQRYATEGITTRAGDVVMKPEDIGAVDAFMVALGLPTKPITDRNFLNAAKFQYDEFYNEKASDIKREYVRAYKEGDNAGLSEAREEWKNLQESRAKNGYTKQPLSTLLKAPQEQKKRERNVTGGVQFNKANRGFVQKTSEL